jgi:F-type H+-transporting ATPase subunit gamma
MAERLADIVSQIQNVRQLQAVITAMRGIAASRAQQSRTLLPGIEAYVGVIARAIGEALNLPASEERASPSPGPGRRGLILFCAEQGFAGAFSERVLDSVRDIEGATVLLVGTRGTVVAEERGINPAWSSAMATHVGNIPTFANRLVDALYANITINALSRIDMLYCRATPGIGIEVIRRSLLPIDIQAFQQPAQAQPPLTTLVPSTLLERLATEYVYAELCEAAMHAFAAENEARMIAMTSARSNIETRLVALTQRERQIRQDEITTEIIELAGGADASAKSAS